MFIHAKYLSLFALLAEGLANVSPETMAQGFQVTESNPMVGLEGRSTLLNRLGHTLKSESKYFPPSGSCPISRPGNLIGL